MFQDIYRSSIVSSSFGFEVLGVSQCISGCNAVKVDYTASHRQETRIGLLNISISCLPFSKCRALK